MGRGQDAHTTIILRFRLIQSSCASAYQLYILLMCLIFDSYFGDSAITLEVSKNERF